MFLFISTNLSFQFHNLDNPLGYQLNFGCGVGVGVGERVNLKMGQPRALLTTTCIFNSIETHGLFCFRDHASSKSQIGPHRYDGFVDIRITITKLFFTTTLL